MIEDRVKSFEFRVTVNLHLTSSVHFCTLFICQKVPNILILDKKCVEIKLSKILSLHNIYSAVENLKVGPKLLFSFMPGFMK